MKKNINNPRSILTTLASRTGSDSTKIDSSSYPPPLRLEWPFKAVSKPSKPFSRPLPSFSFPRSLSLLLAVILAVFYTVFLSTCSDESSTPTNNQTNSQTNNLLGGPLVIGHAGYFQNGHHFIAFILAPSDDYTGDPTTDSFKIVLQKSTADAPSRQEILDGAGIVRYPHSNEVTASYTYEDGTSTNYSYSDRISIIAYDIDSKIANFITTIRSGIYPRIVYHSDAPSPSDESQGDIDSHLLETSTEYTIYAVQINADSPVYELGKRTTSGLDALEPWFRRSGALTGGALNFSGRSEMAIIFNSEDDALLIPHLFEYASNDIRIDENTQDPYHSKTTLHMSGTTIYTFEESVGTPIVEQVNHEYYTAVIHPSIYVGPTTSPHIFEYQEKKYVGLYTLYKPAKMPVTTWGYLIKFRETSIHRLADSWNNLLIVPE